MQVYRLISYTTKKPPVVTFYSDIHSFLHQTSIAPPLASMSLVFTIPLKTGQMLTWLTSKTENWPLFLSLSLPLNSSQITVSKSQNWYEQVKFQEHRNRSRGNKVGVRERSPLTKDILHKSITKKQRKKQQQKLPNSNTLLYISLLSFLNF